MNTLINNTSTVIRIYRDAIQCYDGVLPIEFRFKDLAKNKIIATLTNPPIDIYGTLVSIPITLTEIMANQDLLNQIVFFKSKNDYLCEVYVNGVNIHNEFIAVR